MLMIMSIANRLEFDYNMSNLDKTDLEIRNEKLGVHIDKPTTSNL
jgi:hypothetical protein